MQEIQRTGLCKCYVCKAPGKLVKNAAGKFQIRCSDTQCRGRTRWGAKEDAIIEWFNLLIYGPANRKKIREEIDKTAKIRAEEYNAKRGR